MTQSEYATLIFYWASEPHPERADEMLACLAASGMADSPETVDPLERIAAALEGIPDVGRSLADYIKQFETEERKL